MVRAHTKFKYQERTVEDIQTQMRQRGGDYDNYINDKYKTYKPADGKNLIRILPATWDNAKHYAFVIYVNYGIGVDEQSYLSLSKMRNEPDPIEEARREAERDGDKKLSGKLTAKQRRCMWVIDRYHEEEGPLLWAAPWTVDRDIVSLCYDEDTRDIIKIDHPVDGCDLRFYRQGTGINTEYNPAKMKVLAKSPLHEDEERENEWLEYILENPVPDCLQYYSYDHISQVFGGRVRADPDDEESPRRTRGTGREEAPARPSRLNRRDDDEDEDEEKPARSRKRMAETADDEEEVVQAKPSRSRAKLPDPDEDEAEDEVEDEPPPKRASIKDRLGQRVNRRGAE
jgi:hypothetical protein